LLSRRCKLASVHDLEEVRQFVERAALSLGGEPEAVGDMVVAVNEAVTNILVHGYGNQSGDLLLEVRCRDDELQVCLEDQAPVFDPLTAPEPDVTLPLEQRPLGGVGVKMMRAFTDELQHEVTAAGGNRLTLKKRQTPADQDR
jgi:serine/threonine-protein kinase RsbW